jgi:hypothetical protein
MVSMNRLVNKFVSSVLAIATSASVAACGAGSHSAAVPQPVPTATAAAQYNGPLSDATLTITVPVPTTSSSTRRPAYVSSSTSKIVFTLNTASQLSAAQVTAVNASQLGAKPVTLGSATCPGPGPWTCTLTIRIPPGSDKITVSAQDASSNILSQQIQTLTVATGVANSFNLTLDANVTTPATSIVINGSGSCQAGPVGAAFGSVGTSPVTFTVTATDAQGKTIVGPGLPKIEVQDNTSTYQTASGTINGTGGTVGFTINQAAQSFILTPSTSGITNASVNVKVVQADSQGTSDGLAFNHSQAFTFSTGPAPPSHNFLAAVEQTGTGTGRVDFFNLSTDAGGPNGFSAFSPAFLAVTASTNQPTQNDVDNPVSLLWDNSGDLIIGNGGTTGGNMACVPVGAIATGANSATTITQNIDDPVGLAYEPRNGTVAVGNNAQGSPPVPELAEYVLTGNYTASTNNLTGTLRTGNGTIGQSLINLPSPVAAGTFAVTLSDGCEADPAPKNWQGVTVANPCGHAGTNEIAIFGPTGSTTLIQDASTFHVDIPFGLTWDSTNSQLIVANYSAYHPGVAFYTTGGFFQKTDGHNYFTNSQNPYMVAANGAGLFAVAYTTALSSDQVQIYTNAPGAVGPTPVFGPIPFNAASNAGCTTYPYGSNAVVNGMTWLSNTRLLISVQSFNSGGTPQVGSVGGQTVGMGLYIFDTATSQTPALWDDQSCTPVAAYPAQKAFQAFSFKPFATAFKP